VGKLLQLVVVSNN